MMETEQDTNAGRHPRLPLNGPELIWCLNHGYQLRLESRNILASEERKVVFQHDILGCGDERCIAFQKFVISCENSCEVTCFGGALFENPSVIGYSRTLYDFGIYRAWLDAKQDELNGIRISGSPLFLRCKRLHVADALQITEEIKRSWLPLIAKGFAECEERTYDGFIKFCENKMNLN